MFKSHIKTAWRNIRENKLFTALNIIGLAIGLCVCIVLSSYIRKELSYDRMFANSEHIYRVNMETSEDYGYEVWGELPNAVGLSMKEEIPQVKLVSRLVKHDFGSIASIKAGEKSFSENNLYLADSDLFEMFDFNFIQGSKESVFSQPNSIVISQSTKQRLFGDKEAIGELLLLNNNKSFQITGVYTDLPEKSVLDCNMIYNILDSWMGKDVHWSNASYGTYVQLEPNTNPVEVQNLATGLIDKYVEKERQYYKKFFLQPLTSIHLYSAGISDSILSKKGSITTIKGLSFLSILVLLIASINYMNLATANSGKRAKGIGVNKILGASRQHLISLLYIETGIMVFLSVVLGYALSFLLLPLFSSITGGDLGIQDLLATPILIGLLLIWFLVTLIAGSYPAISISSISPLVLVNKSKGRSLSSEMIRKTLVVFQFTASIVLIIAVTIVLQQMDFIRKKDLGYQPDGVVSVSVNSARSKEQITNLMRDYEDQANILSVSAVQSLLGAQESGRTITKLETDSEGLPVSSNYTFGGVAETLNLNLLAGSDIPRNIAVGDSTLYALVNQKVIRYLGYDNPEEAIGKVINYPVSGGQTIVTGVIEDFVYKSLKEEVGGYLYYSSNSNVDGIRNLLVRYNTDNLSELLNTLENSFTKSFPNVAFEYQFLDKRIEQLYAEEQQTASMTSLFSGLAIFIACLGLFGLAAFTAEQRRKEIGVRKVLGASVTGITKLLTKDFLKLVAIAFVIAVPIAYWLMKRWLLDFAFRTEIHWWVFAIAGLLAVAIAFITISSQAIKAAVSNPIKSLRTE